MDKLLLTAFLTALAGFITFVLSIVKLVNEKESTTTGYRQAWTDSVRSCLAGLIANLNAMAAATTNHLDIVESRAEIKPAAKGNEDDHSRVKDFLEVNLTSSVNLKRQLRKEIYEAYALARLHFKPNDLSFARIEHKFDTVMSLIENIDDDAKKEKRASLKEKIHADVNEITGYCRDILKTEWETVKRGEPMYQNTKLYSIYGGVLTLFVLLAIGAYAGIAAIRGDQHATADISAAVYGTPPQKTVAGDRETQKTVPNCSSVEINVTNSGHGTPTKGTTVSQRPRCDATILQPVSTN